MTLVFFFFQKSPTDSGGSALRPSVVRLTYTSLLNMFPHLDVFSPRLAKSWLHAKPRPQLVIFHSTISLSHKKLRLWWWEMEGRHTKKWEVGEKKVKNPCIRIIRSHRVCSGVKKYLGKFLAATSCILI